MKRKCLLSSRFGYIPFKALKAISFFNLKSLHFAFTNYNNIILDNKIIVI